MTPTTSPTPSEVVGTERSRVASEYSPVSDIEDSTEGNESETPPYIPGPNDIPDMINNPMPEAMQIELVRGHAMGIIGPTTTWSDDEDDEEEEEEEVEVVVDAQITP